MRKWCIALCCVLLMMTFCTAADGETQITAMQTEVQLNEDSSCLVTQQFTVDFSGADSEFLIPMGKGASEYTIGMVADTVRRNGVTCFSLSNPTGFHGQQSFTVSYRLPVQVTVDGKTEQTLDLSILSAGFSCTIENWSIRVTFPKSVQVMPTLVSGSHGDTAFNDFDTKLEEQEFSAQLLGKMNENDSLRLQADLPAGFFDLSNLPGRAYTPFVIAFGVFAVLAIGYWLVFLRNPLPWVRPRRLLPANVTAGEIGCYLACDAPDLAALVMQWANLGYLSIQRTRRGQLVLVRQMPMGNERRPVETKLFSALFGRRNQCSVQSEHFARLTKRMHRPFRAACNRRIFGEKPGSVLSMRVLAALAAGMLGIAAFDRVVGMSSAHWVIVLALAIGYGALSWLLQQTVIGLLRRRAMRAGIVCGMLMVSLCVVNGAAGVRLLGFLNLLMQLLIGAAAIPGGKRSADGMDLMTQLLGYRRYLRTQSVSETVRRTASNPQYFYQVLPYAEAFGVGKKFAKHCAAMHLEPCPWLHGWHSIPSDPMGFYALYASIVSSMRHHNGQWHTSRKAQPVRRRTQPAAARPHETPKAEPASAVHVRTHRQGTSVPNSAQAPHMRPHRRVEQNSD